MRVILIVIAMLICLPGAAAAAGDVKRETPVIPWNPDLLMYKENGDHVLLHFYDLYPRVQYLCRFRFYAGDERIEETEILAPQGLPAVITDTLAEGKQRVDQPIGDYSYLIVIRTPDVPFPLGSIGCWGLDAVPDWNDLTRLRLRDLEFYVDCPAANRVEITAEKWVTPAAVIDEREGNIVLAMHHPDDLPPEPYGEVRSLLGLDTLRLLTRRPFSH